MTDTRLYGEAFTGRARAILLSTGQPHGLLPQEPGSAVAQLAPRSYPFSVSLAIWSCNNRIVNSPEATGRAVQAIQRGAVQADMVSLHSHLHKLWRPAPSSCLPISHGSNSSALQVTVGYGHLCRLRDGPGPTPTEGQDLT